MKIVHMGPGDEGVLLAAAELFDSPATERWTKEFLAREGHHILVAFEGDEPIGFITGVETVHPDKGTEMFLYELGVHPQHRRRGVGRALTGALEELARERGCYGMWVGTEPGNEAALATYRSAGAAAPEDAVVFIWSFEPRE